MRTLARFRQSMSAERLFVTLTLPFGLALCVAAPPFGGGDEHFHFQRTVEIAYGGIVSQVTVVPKGFVQFIDEGHDTFVRPHPTGYTLNDFRALAAIPTSTNGSAELHKNAFTVHNPVNYVVPAFAVRAAAGFNPPVFWLFWLARITSMCVATALLWVAIRAMPVHKYAFAAIAMLPTAVFYRSMISADGVTIGAAFIFVAFLLRAYKRSDVLSGKDVVQLCATATLVGLSKGAYAPLTLMLLAIPRTKFAASSGRAKILAFGVIPAFIGGFGWMLLVKRMLFTDFQYTTWAGRPDSQAQVAFILREPLSYLGVLAHTVTQSTFVPDALIGIIGELGHGNTFLPAPAYAFILVLLAALLWQSPRAMAPQPTFDARFKVLAVAVFAMCVGLTLTLLYAQWTAVRAPAIQGFQGRYVIPLLPLLLILVPQRRTEPRVSPSLLFSAASIIGCAFCAIALLRGYYSITI